MIKCMFKHPGFWRVGGLALVAVLVGCTPNSQPLEPKILTFNYVETSYADPAALIASLQSGQTTVADELPANPCNFTAHVANSWPLSIDIIGNPGTTGFNVTISSATLVNLTTTNPGNCRPVTEIVVNIGSSNEALDVGGRTNSTSAEMVVGGNRYDTGSGFFEGSLTTFRQQSGYATGEFQFVSDSPGTAANVLLLVSGFYADD
jgi:hypothetical protein